MQHDAAIPRDDVKSMNRARALGRTCLVIPYQPKFLILWVSVEWIDDSNLVQRVVGSNPLSDLSKSARRENMPALCISR